MKELPDLQSRRDLAKKFNLNLSTVTYRLKKGIPLAKKVPNRLLTMELDGEELSGSGADWADEFNITVHNFHSQFRHRMAKHGMSAEEALTDLYNKYVKV